MALVSTNRGLVVGLTGGIGSGKSKVSRLLAERWSVPVIDADLVAREVVKPGMPANRAITERYPDAALDDGSLDRPWLRRNVLPDDTERRWLESVTHPAIRTRILDWLQSETRNNEYVVLESPLLLESGQADLCDLVVVVDALEQQQIHRASQRDSQTPEQIRTIMAKQLGRQERLQRADIVVDNTGPVERLADQTAALHDTLSQRASQLRGGR